MVLQYVGSIKDGKKLEEWSDTLNGGRKWDGMEDDWVVWSVPVALEMMVLRRREFSHRPPGLGQAPPYANAARRTPSRICDMLYHTAARQHGASGILDQ